MGYVAEYYATLKNCDVETHIKRYIPFTVFVYRSLSIFILSAYSPFIKLTTDKQQEYTYKIIVETVRLIYSI